MSRYSRASEGLIGVANLRSATLRNSWTTWKLIVPAPVGPYSSTTASTIRASSAWPAGLGWMQVLSNQRSLSAPR